MSESQRKSSEMELLAHLHGQIVTVRVAEQKALYRLDYLQESGPQRPLTAAYRATPVNPGNKVAPWNLVIKVPRADGLQESEFVERIAKVKAQFDTESEVLSRLCGATCVPLIFNCNVFLGDVELKTLTVRQYIEGISLDRWMQDYAAEHGDTTFTGMKSMEDWFTLAWYLISLLERIHQERVFHGDLRPENIILQVPKRGHLPDPHTWKESIWFVNVEEEGVAVAGLADLKKPGVYRRKYDAPSRLFEIRAQDGEARQRNITADWYAPADIFSLGAILLELACGRGQDLQPFLHENAVFQKKPGDGHKKQPEERTIWNQVLGYEKQQTDRSLKTFVEKALKAAQKGRKEPIDRAGLLRMTEAIMACVRTQTETQSSDLRHVSVIVDQFRPTRSDSADNRKERDWEKPFLDAVRTAAAPFPSPLQKVMLRRADLLLRDLTTCADTSVFRIAGSRAHLVDVLITLLRDLNETHAIRAVTTPTFFFDGNMGPYGRVTSALQLAFLAGVDIEWIIVVNDQGLRERKVAEVLEAQRQLMQQVRQTRKISPKSGVHYAVVSPEDYNDTLRQKHTFIEIGPVANSPDCKDNVLVAPDYRGEAGSISVFRLWAISEENKENIQKRRKKLQANFIDLKNHSRPVSAYMR